MKKLKIKFTDFWTGFDPEKSLLYLLLSKKYHLEVSDSPDLLIYSCFGREYLNYDCHRLYFTAERRRSHFSDCDFCVSFEKKKNDNQYYLPYIVYKIFEKYSITDLKRLYSVEEASGVWQSKLKFCAMVVSSESSDYRLSFYKKLNAQKAVDSGGKALNNVGGPVKNKQVFMSQYRFNMAFENESYPYYLTEKLCEAMLTGSIPVYWGDPYVNKFFNEKRFLNVANYKNDQELINHILEIDQNPDLAVEILKEPILSSNIDSELLDIRNFEKFLWTCVEKMERKTPVARTPFKYIRPLKFKIKKIFNV